MIRKGPNRLWVKWRRYSYQGYMARGLPGHLAWQIAKAETTARQKMARVIGRRAAEDAELEILARGDTIRFALTGSLTPLTADQIDRLPADLVLYI